MRSNEFVSVLQDASLVTADAIAQSIAVPMKLRSEEGRHHISGKKEIVLEFDC
jgi:hypothetical protein